MHQLALLFELIINITFLKIWIYSLFYHKYCSFLQILGYSVSLWNCYASPTYCRNNSNIGINSIYLPFSKGQKRMHWDSNSHLLWMMPPNREKRKEKHLLLVAFLNPVWIMIPCYHIQKMKSLLRHLLNMRYAIHRSATIHKCSLIKISILYWFQIFKCICD